MNTSKNISNLHKRLAHLHVPEKRDFYLLFKFYAERIFSYHSGSRFSPLIVYLGDLSKSAHLATAFFSTVHSPRKEVHVRHCPKWFTCTPSSNVPKHSQTGVIITPILYSKKQAQRGYVTCSGSHSRKVTEQDGNPEDQAPELCCWLPCRPGPGGIFLDT